MALSLAGLKRYERLPPQQFDMGGIVPAGSFNTNYNFWVFEQDGYLCLTNGMTNGLYVYDAATLTPLLTVYLNSYGGLGCITIIDDVLIVVGYSDNYWYGIPLKGKKTLAGVATPPPFSAGHATNINVGSVIGTKLHTSNQAIGGQYSLAWRYPDSRFKVSPKTANDTNPNISDPGAAPTCQAQATGGFLSNGTYYVAYAWITKADTTRRKYGATLPSAEQTVTLNGGGSTQSIDVTIPALPAGAIGVLVYCGTVSGQLKLAFGSKDCGAVNTLKYNPAALNIDKVVFNRSGASFATWDGTAIASANGFAKTDKAPSGWASYPVNIPVFNPFLKEGHILSQLCSWGSAGVYPATDDFNMATMTAGAANQAVTYDSGKIPLPYQSYSPLQVVMVPELAGYLVYGPNSDQSGTGIQQRYVVLKSCITHEILWGMQGIWTNYSGSGWGWGGDGKNGTFQMVDGEPFATWLDAKNRFLVRQPIHILE